MTRYTLSRHRRDRGRGFSMIEVLMVILLFSFGLLGLAGLQARATQTSMAAEDSTRAALLAGELASQMWGQGTVTLPTATVATWKARLSAMDNGGLPDGDGSVDVTGNVARITVTWHPPHESAGRTYRYVTEVVIP